MEGLSGLHSQDLLELTSRSVLGAPCSSDPPSERENDLIFNDLYDPVGEWLKPEVAPLRFARPN